MDAQDFDEAPHYHGQRSVHLLTHVESDAQLWKDLLAAALGGGKRSTGVVRGRYRIGPACCVLQTGRSAPGDRRGRIAGQNRRCSL